VSFKPAFVKPMLNELLSNNGIDYERFLASYRQAFDARKGTIQQVSQDGAPMAVIHPVMQKVLEIAIDMVEVVHPRLVGYYRFVYENRLNALVAQSLTSQKIPNFSIHVASQYNEKNPNFFSCVLPIECKKLNRTSNGVRQSVTYALEHLNFCLELSRDIDAPFDAYSISTDGYCISLNRITLKNRTLIHQGSLFIIEKDSLLLPINLLEARNTDLATLPGFVAILALLTFPTCFGVGFEPKIYSPTIFEGYSEKIDIHNVLGIGGFSTVLIASIRNEARKALKLPTYSTDILERKKQIEQIFQEIRILKLLLEFPDSTTKNYIPKLSDYSDAVPFLAVTDIGCTLQVFVDNFLTRWEDRRSFIQRLEPLLKSLCLSIYDWKQVTHRDIRPSNIVMVRRGDPNNNEDIFRGHNPLLIDWGVADYEFSKFNFSGRSTQFLADEIYRAKESWIVAESGDPLIKYLHDYDNESIEYTMTAIQHNGYNFGAPWSAIPNDENLALLVRNYLRERRFHTPIPNPHE
jgi:hypothetical protein